MVVTVDGSQFRVTVVDPEHGKEDREVTDVGPREGDDSAGDSLQTSSGLPSDGEQALESGLQVGTTCFFVNSPLWCGF